ncbi:hypothetical protein TNCV_925341 [Trichonephila clavipes]|nr:hypothetical protein TNCV_925341 [Trichonephila clavipes]
MSHCSATRGLLATDHVILNHGQVTWTTPELAPPSPNYHTTPTGFLFEEGIVRMERPACSPDMNPIEHVWDALRRRVAGRQPPP